MIRPEDKSALNEHSKFNQVDKGKSIITDLEKKDIIKKGFPSKAKIGSTKKVYANAYKKKNK